MLHAGTHQHDAQAVHVGCIGARLPVPQEELRRRVTVGAALMRHNLSLCRLSSEQAMVAHSITGCHAHTPSVCKGKRQSAGITENGRATHLVQKEVIVSLGSGCCTRHS